MGVGALTSPILGSPPCNCKVLGSGLWVQSIQPSGWSPGPSGEPVVVLGVFSAHVGKLGLGLEPGGSFLAPEHLRSKVNAHLCVSIIRYASDTLTLLMRASWPTSRVASDGSWGRMGTWNLSGPCSDPPPLQPQRF